MTAVRISDTAIRAVVQFPRIFSASSLRPLPSMMEALGAPPMLTRAAKAEMAMCPSGGNFMSPVAVQSAVKAEEAEM